MTLLSRVSKTTIHSFKLRLLIDSEWLVISRYVHFGADETLNAETDVRCRLLVAMGVGSTVVVVESKTSIAALEAVESSREDHTPPWVPGN